LRGLRAGIGKADRITQLCKAACTAVPFDEHLDIRLLEDRRLHERVQANDRDCEPAATAEVECRACRGCRWNAAYQG
jgi:hypothetical protein